MKTMQIKIEDAPANALDLCRDMSSVVVAGRNMIRIFSIEDDKFVEKTNLATTKRGTYHNLTCSDVVWCRNDEQLIATGLTNGAVVLWNLAITGRSKQERVYEDHKRTINKVCFHPTEAHYLIAGSSGGDMTLFDTRSTGPIVFQNNTNEAVRDVQFNPHSYWQFAAVSENHHVQLWDMRRTDRTEHSWSAHSSPVFTCDWHPEKRCCLATGGRDRTIKIWDTSKGGTRHEAEQTIQTMAPVRRVKWRPQRKDYLGHSALVDTSINVWDVKRPYVPFALFEHKDHVTDIAWLGDPHRLIATSKDSTLTHHVFDDAVRPGDRANPVGLGFSGRGEVTHASRMIPKQPKPLIFPGSKVIPKRVPLSDLFRMCKSRLAVHTFPYPTSSTKLNQTETSLDTTCDISMSDEEVVRGIALSYKLTDGSLEELCDLNSATASRMNKEHVALTWNIIKTLYACPMRCETRPLSGEVGNSTDEWKEEKRMRSLSGKMTRSRQPSRNITGKLNIGQTGRNISGNTSCSDSESDDQQEEDTCQTLTDIASGCTASAITGDFFGDSELAGLGVEHLISLEGGAGGGGCPVEGDTLQHDWLIPSEAFEQRQEILETSTGRNEDLLLEGGETTDYTVTVEDKSSSMVVWGTHAALNTRHLWTNDSFLAESLNWYCENGDVQSAVSIYLVLAGGRNGEVNSVVKGLVDDSVLEHWFLSYIELLQRLQLFTTANEIIRLCPLERVNTMNCQSTTILSSCGFCGRSLVRKLGIWWCEKCRKSPSTCSVCHGVVRGLLVWCQGCGHGGHIHHVKEWMQKQRGCPAGCGHHCQY